MMTSQTRKIFTDCGKKMILLLFYRHTSNEQSGGVFVVQDQWAVTYLNEAGSTTHGRRTVATSAVVCGVETVSFYMTAGIPETVGISLAAWRTKARCTATGRTEGVSLAAEKELSPVLEEQKPDRQRLQYILGNR